MSAHTRITDVNGTMHRKAELEAYKETINIGLASRDLYEYVKLTNRGYKPNKFGEFVDREVQEFLLRDTQYAYEILIITSPPQHGKSTNITGSAPSWLLGQKPDSEILLLSYNDPLAHRFGNMNLTKVREFHKKLFNLELEDKAQCTATDFQLKGHKGSLRSRGLTSGISGNAGAYIFIDDPIKNREEADSQGVRDKIWASFLSDVISRLGAKAKIVVILTRWHEDDIAGRIEAYMNMFDNVRTIRIPCICEEEATDPLGRKLGEALSPELGKNKEWAEQTRDIFLNDPTQGGKRTWDALYQGRPSALEGNILDVSWFKFWKPVGTTLPKVKLQLSNGELYEVEAEDLPLKDDGNLYWDGEIQSWDCAFKDKATSDYVCGGYWTRRLANYYLMDSFHKIASFVDTITALETMTRKYPKAVAKYIEDKANGTAIINSMRQKISGLIPVEATNDKTARLRAVTPVFQSGNVYLPHPSLYPWVREYMKELLDFPNGKNDDYVDMTSQALNVLMFQSADTLKTTIPKGTWAYPRLKDMGYSDTEIRGAYRAGIIKLYMIPEKYRAKWQRAR